MKSASKNNIISVFNDDDIKNHIILTIPHSGRSFPEDFLSKSNLSIEELRTSEDPYVDELVAPLIEQGFCALRLDVPRTYIDVNRDKIELDEQMFEDFPKDELAVNSKYMRFGFGVLHRVDSERRPIYKEKLTYKEAINRIETVYDAYHKKLSELIERTVAKFGKCLVLDMHSMPAKICNIMIDEKAVDFCVSTLFEQSAPKEVYEKFGEQLGIFGHRVEYNRPYSGSYTTFHYCQPKKNIYTMQLEINRSIYVDEKTYEKTPAFETLKNHLSQSVLSLVDI